MTKPKRFPFEALSEMNRQQEIAKLEKKQAEIMKQLAEIETKLHGKGMTPEWDSLVTTRNNLHTDTYLIRRKLEHLNRCEPALGYGDDIPGHLTGVKL